MKNENEYCLGADFSKQKLQLIVTFQSGVGAGKLYVTTCYTSLYQLEVGQAPKLTF